MNRMLAAVALLGFASLAGAQEMKPGQWELTTTMQMQGMKIPATKFMHCYTARDIAAGKHYSADKNSQCTISNLKTGGGAISYDMACAMEGGRMNGSVKGTVSATAYTFEQRMRMTPDQGMGEMHSTIQGRRIGDCK